MADTAARLQFIDALRGFAIIGVVYTHAAGLTNISGRSAQVAAAGGEGVLLFFVVSACTIFMTLSRSLQREERPIANFFLKRLMRLLPIYWLGMIAYSVIYGLASRGWRHGPELWHYPLHATLTNSLWPTTVNSVVPGGWSISCEAIFYLTVPLWIHLVRSWRGAVLFLVASIAGGMIVTRALHPLLGPLFSHLDPIEVARWWDQYLFVGQIGVFACGILLYFLALRDRPLFLDRLTRGPHNLALLSAGTLMLAIATFARVPGLPSRYVFGIAFLLLALAIAYRPWRLFVNPLTVFFGRVSYSAYIVHFIVLKQLDDHVALPGQPLAHALLLTAISMPIVVGVAYFGFRYVETPTSRLAKLWIDRWERRGDATSARMELQTAP